MTSFAERRRRASVRSRESLGQCTRHILALCGLLALAGCGGGATRSNLAFAPVDTAPRSGFVAVAPNVRLHYLDWGGRGEVILLIPGLYGSPEVYSEFAPLLTDRFRVLALSRRGHGRSDEPPTGYEPDSLVEDVRAFFDSLGIGRAHLIGHSLAGVELTAFAGRYPERVRKLVYLDAAYDRQHQGRLPASPAQSSSFVPEIRARARASTKPVRA